MLSSLHLGDAEARSSRIGFHKAGEPETTDDVGIRWPRHAPAYEDAVRDMHFGEGAKEIVESKLVECQGFHEHATRAIGHPDDVKVALQDAVLAGRSVDGDVGKVEGIACAVVGKTEIVAINGANRGSGIVVLRIGLPVGSHHDVHRAALLLHQIAIIFFTIHE